MITSLIVTRIYCNQFCLYWRIMWLVYCTGLREAAGGESVREHGWATAAGGHRDTRHAHTQVSMAMLLQQEDTETPVMPTLR